jgi:hypothetical protein
MLLVQTGRLDAIAAEADEFSEIFGVVYSVLTDRQAGLGIGS